MASNAHYIGIDGVEYAPAGEPLPVRAHEHSLEDVVSHVLRNAERHRLPGTPIRIALQADAGGARVSIHNQGAAIADGMLERIFEYGVSEAPDAAALASAARASSWRAPTWRRWAAP